MHIHMDVSMHVYFGKGVATAREGNLCICCNLRGKYELNDPLIEQRLVMPTYQVTRRTCSSLTMHLVT